MTDPTAPAGAPAMPKMPLARVVDVYHGDVHRTDPVADFRGLGEAGIWGLIHKARASAWPIRPMRRGPGMRGHPRGVSVQ